MGKPPGTNALGSSRENPISYKTFVDMFLPELLERYKKEPSSALYEKITPVIYWKPPPGAQVGRGHSER